LRIACILILMLPSAWAFASDDPCYIAYHHVDKSFEFRACEAAANAGVADAEFGYGLILFSGFDRQNDRRAALDWFRKSARQGHQLAQVALGILLNNKDTEAELRNPVEAYAWTVTAGDQKAAARLRAALGERDKGAADRLAAEYAGKYGRPRSDASRWWSAAEVLLRLWPEFVVLSFLALARKRLQRKMLFVFAGSVIAYASLYVVNMAWRSDIVPTLATRITGAENLGNALTLSLSVYALFALATPLLAVFVLSRFLRGRNAAGARYTRDS
jgi:TPR repeat protein